MKLLYGMFVCLNHLEIYLQDNLKELGELPYPRNDTYGEAEGCEVESTNIFIKKGYSLAKVGELVHETTHFKESDFKWLGWEQGFSKKHPYNEYHPQKGYIE